MTSDKLLYEGMCCPRVQCKNLIVFIIVIDIAVSILKPTPEKKKKTIQEFINNITALKCILTNLTKINYFKKSLFSGNYKTLSHTYLYITTYAIYTVLCWFRIKYRDVKFQKDSTKK